jgi:hypothetical protein
MKKHQDRNPEFCSSDTLICKIWGSVGGDDLYSSPLAYDTVYLGRHTNIFEKILLAWDVPLCCWMFSFWYFKGA